jgi:hypothetical protein
MKNNPKFLLLVLALVLTQFLIQPSANAQTFSKGDAVINLGVGLGSAYSLDPAASVGIGLNASVEYGVYQLNKVGVFSAGGIFSWSHASAGYTGYDLAWNELYFGARAAFHLTMLDIDNLDVYGGVTLGIRSHSVPEWDVQTQRDVNHYVVDPFGGIFVGGRWYFTPGFGVFSELGYDVSWFKAGISLKF